MEIDLSQPCISYEDAIAQYPCAVEGLCVSRSVVENEIEIAIELVSQFLCKDLCLKRQCRQLDGTGSNTLYLNSTLHSLESVTIDGESLSIDQITVAPSYLSFSDCRSKFYCGDRNVQVCGIWGEIPPAGVKKVIISLALEAAQPGITGLEGVNQDVSAISWGDVSITYSPLESQTGFTTGFIDLDNILSLYLDAGDSIGIMVVGSCDSCNTKQNCNCKERKNKCVK